MKTDVHVHFAGTADGCGCYVSDEFRKSLKFRLMRVVSGQILKFDHASLRRHLVDALDDANLVDSVVVLALDQVYTDKGVAVPEATHLYVNNQCVADLARSHRKILFGASVHPDRPGALELLHRLAEQDKAALVKWVPSCQDIDPADERHTKFYQKLVDLRLPLLCHVGKEHTIPSAYSDCKKQLLNDPNRLKLALDSGVTVIGAHCACPMSDDGDEIVYTLDFLKLMEDHENLYGDVSAFFTFYADRMKWVRRVLKDASPDRLILGSDYPVPILPILPGLSPGTDLDKWTNALGETNPFDRNVLMLRAAGFSEKIFANADKVLRLS